MKHNNILVGLIALGILVAGGYGLYRLGMKQGSGMVGTPAAPESNAGAPMKTGDVDPSTGKKVLYWHDPMVPGQKFDKPGKSPFMDMMLVPVYADGGGDDGGISISPRVQQNLGVRTAEVMRSVITPSVKVAGSIAFNERDQAVVQARATGYVERLHVRATLDRVAKGQPLADLYVPDWVAAQEEFLAVRRMQGSDLAALVDGARQRMRQAGMSEEQIRLVESSGQVHPRITLSAPISGVVVELAAREGMAVMPGATLFRINGLFTVWANAAVPETQAALLRPGAMVEAHAAALQGAVFKGKVQALLPEVDAATRTLKARVELSNPGAQLAPGMFISIALTSNAKARTEALTVPTEAVIQTGKRTVVMLAEDGGKFRPVDVVIGVESNGQTEIKQGLELGEKVVVSGQFLVDSEASLRATGTRMEGSAATQDHAMAEHSGQAKVEAVHQDSVTLSHGPIASLQWGPMTMDFAAPAAGLPPGLKPGQRVKFAFVMDKDGMPVLTRIEPMEKQP